MRELWAGYDSTPAPPPPAPGMNVPTAPTDLRSAQSHGSDIEILFMPPASDGGSPVLGYKIYFRVLGATPWQERLARPNSPGLPTVPSGHFEYTLTGLSADTV